MKIYTRTGDAGETALFDGTRVSKADPRVDAYGDVDEVNAWLGFVRAAGVPPDLDAELVQIQRDLFAMGALLADPSHKIADRVEKAVRFVDGEVNPLVTAVLQREDAFGSCFIGTGVPRRFEL